MIFPNSWGAPEWLIPALIFVAIASALVVWNYWRSELSTVWKLSLGAIKLLAIALLGLFLLEPLCEFEQVEPGANLFIVLADQSQSMEIKDRNSSTSRMEDLRSELVDSTWLAQLEDQFEVRKYVFDSRVESVPDFDQLAAEGQGSQVVSALNTVSDRFTGRPLSGILLFSDGNATDWQANSQLDSLPPVFPVLAGRDAPAKDIGISQISTSQTNFESAPVTIIVEAITYGFAGKSVIATLSDMEGNEVERKEIKNVKDESPFGIRFQLKPEDRGVSVYQVKLHSANDPDSKNESTALNNRRMVLIDRGRGPFRVLYVCGRPNWEYKFLRRALADDHELDLVGLVRLAKKEPKFSFRSRDNESTNPLFRGFGNEEDQTAEQYDEPVIIRLDTMDDQELRDGFPKDAETLYKYDAVIIDDLESEFFTQDQKSLLQDFVSRRGGGLLMLGGQESFGQGSL